MDGIIDKGIYWHIVSATLFQGGAIAMGVAIVVRFLLRNGLAVRGMDLKLANGTLVALLAVWNLAFAILAMITGIWMTWGFETVTSTSITINKAMFGTFSLLSLVLMIWIRFRHGPGLWNDVSLKITYGILGLIAAGAAVVNGSLGGEASLVGTVLAPVWDTLGVIPRYPMVLPATGGILLALIAVAGVGLAMVVKRSRKQTPAPEAPAKKPTVVAAHGGGA